MFVHAQAIAELDFALIGYVYSEKTCNMLSHEQVVYPQEGDSTARVIGTSTSDALWLLKTLH